MSDLYAALRVKKTATAAEIKAAYRALALKHHPDHGGSEAEFKRLTAAYEVLSDPAQRERYDRHGLVGPIVILSYAVERLGATGDVADIYKATGKGRTVALKVARAARDNDLMAAEWANLRAIRPVGTEEVDKHRYFPRPIESFKVNDGRGAPRQVNVVDWLDHFHPLTAVRDHYRDGVKMEHGVWMLNRVLEALSVAHAAGVAHGAVLPPHVLVYASPAARDPFNHGAKLVDWTHSVKLGDKLRAISPAWRHMYPPEVFDKAPVTPATDIFMAVRSIAYVLGGNPVTHEYPSHVPGYLRSFFKGCTLANVRARPQDALSLHRELHDHLAKHYGPKKYVRFDMPQAA